MTWAYGVTCVESRRQTLLPTTLASLRQAGFDRPTLFVDGTRDVAGWEREFGLPVEAHTEPIKAWGNWLLAVHELFIRNPTAERFAIFQDDILACRNLRAYLDGFATEDAGYWNLYAHGSDQERARGVGWYPSGQWGRGALALVFSRAVVGYLLQSTHAMQRHLGADKGKALRNIDGAVAESLCAARGKAPKDWREYCHNPPLVQHAGTQESTIRATSYSRQSSAAFRGENFDALELVKEL